MSANPRVSIGVPVYNGGRFLGESLDSLLAQTYEDFELIISDNASTDETEEVCRSYAAKDRRVRYFRNEVNRGAAWNHNRLVELATGEYFKWAMADDVCKPDLVGRCIDVLDSDSSVVLACVRTIFIDQDNNIVRTLDPGWNLQADAPYERLRSVIYAGGHWVNADALAGVTRLAALQRTRLLPHYQGGDKRPLAELSLLGKFVEIPEYLYLRRLHPRSSSQNNPAFSRDRAKSVEWMAEFFKASRWEVTLPTWHLVLDHVRTVANSDLSVNHKMTLLAAVLRMACWKRKLLFRELTATASGKSKSYVVELRDA